MKIDEVPQHDVKAFAGRKKVLYSLDPDGHYALTASSGWEAEEIVLDQAIGEFRKRAAVAWRGAEQGLCSPLPYHMYHERMDVAMLAQSTGFFRWQVRRHLRPGPFRRLSGRRLQRYANALGLTVAQLMTIPERP